MDEEARNRAIEHWNEFIRTGRTTMGSDITRQEKKMAFELNEGQGSLFGNNKKTKDTQPDWKGSIKIGGKVYRIAGWTRQGKSGEPFYSLQVDKYDLPKSDGKDIEQALPAQDDEIRY